MQNGWNRAARTDKGVHAAGNVISCKLEVVQGKEEETVDRINSCLPSDIRVFKILRQLLFSSIVSYLERPRISTPRISAIVASTNTFFPSKRSLPSALLLLFPSERIFPTIGKSLSKMKPTCRSAESTPRIRSTTPSRIVPIIDNVSNRFKSHSNCFSTRLPSPLTQRMHRIEALEGVLRKTSGQPISLWRYRDCEHACRCLQERTISTITRWASPVPIPLRRDTFQGFR